MRGLKVFSFVALSALLADGCSKVGTPESTSGPANPLATSILIQVKPEGAMQIVESREQSKHGDEIVVVGQVGGEEKPFVDGTAAFSLVDLSLPACTEGCPTPWDFCCDTDKLPTHKILVKIVDENGKTVATDARDLLGIKELSTLVVKGKAKRDDVGNLTVLATSVFVERK